MSLVEQSLGALARSIPGATSVFHEYKLDFCCGGKISLRAAAEEKGLDAEAIAARLAALPSAAVEERNWCGAGNQELIAHLQSRYHDVHRQQLPELIRLARRVEHVHGDNPNCPNGLADHLDAMYQELESHMIKEEQILFPMLLKTSVEVCAGPISVMRFEHDHHGEALGQVDELTNGITLPRGACNTWRALYLGLAQLRRDLMQHIHLENNLLFEGLATA